MLINIKNLKIENNAKNLNDLLKFQERLINIDDILESNEQINNFCDENCFFNISVGDMESVISNIIFEIENTLTDDIISKLSTLNNHELGRIKDVINNIISYKKGGLK